MTVNATNKEFSPDDEMLIFYPAVGWTISALPDRLLAIELEVSRWQPGMTREEALVKLAQVSLTRAQARSLGASLLRAAEQQA